MTQKVFDKHISAIVQSLVECEEQRRLAVRRQDIRNTNRWFDRVSAILDDLTGQGPEGRAALEALLNHTSSFVRLSAAAKVREWAPDLAIPVLADLYLVEREPNASPSERNEVNMSAKGLLYRIFGITSYDPDDLIEPLKDYGIAWPTMEQQLKAAAARRDRKSGAQ